MGTAIRIGRSVALSLYGFATLAIAQPVPELEVDFANANANIPLSPALSTLIAIVIAACGLYALRRSRGGGRIGAWAVIGLATLPLAHALSQTQLIGEARAISVVTLPLTNSPATITANFSAIYRPTNATGSNVTLVAIKLNNPGNFSIYAPDTTCVSGLSLAPGAFCNVHIVELL